MEKTAVTVRLLLSTTGYSKINPIQTAFIWDSPMQKQHQFVTNLITVYMSQSNVLTTQLVRFLSLFLTNTFGYPQILL